MTGRGLVYSSICHSFNVPDGLNVSDNQYKQSTLSEYDNSSVTLHSNLFIPIPILLVRLLHLIHVSQVFVEVDIAIQQIADLPHLSLHIELTVVHPKETATSPFETHLRALALGLACACATKSTLLESALVRRSGLAMLSGREWRAEPTDIQTASPK